MASLEELRADLLRRLAKFLPMEESSAAATSSLSTTASTKRTAAAPLAPIATTTPKLVSDPVLEQQMTKPSSSLVFSAGQVVGDGGPHADAVFASALPTRCSTMCLDVNGGSDCAVDAFPSMDNTRPEVAAPTELTYGCVNATSSTDAVVPAKCSTVGLDPNIGAVEVGDSYQQSGIVSTVNPGLVGAPDQPGLHLARPPPWPVWMSSVPSTASPTFRSCKGVQTETRTFQLLIPDMAEIADEDSSTSIDLICALCDNGGEIASCAGKCLRSFHATKDAGEDCKTLCYARAQFDAMKVFLCKNCGHERYQCFAGHRLGSAKTDPPEVFPCASANCGHFYHATGVAQLLFPQNDAKATEYTTKIINGWKFACPVHSCHTCTYGENKEVTEQQFAVCRRCPKSYHTVEDHAVQLTTEVLNLLELQDILEAQQLSLSINALSGAADGDTVRIRALVQNQVMLMLVDTGSSHSFRSSSFVDRVHCTTTKITPVSVRVANNEVMHCNTMIKNFEWGTHGETFSHDMRILPLGAYDAIIGMDWLKLHGDMVCNWAQQTLKFSHKGRQVVLQGIQPNPLLPLQEVPIEQVLKWSKGNDLWALAVLESATEEQQQQAPCEERECYSAQVLIKWKGIPATSATWEDLYVLKQRCPAALAWGQASFSGGGDVTPGDTCVLGDKD